MARANGGAGGVLRPEQERAEEGLVQLASSRSLKELSLSEKEKRILELYDQIQEQQLEEALLKQDPVNVEEVEDIDEQLAKAERELLEARSTHSLQRKAAETVLMTDPIIQSIHSEAKTPIERSLLPLVGRRDLLSLIYENLARAHSTCLEKLSDAEIENLKITDENKELVRTVQELTKPQEKTGKELLTDPKLREQVEELEVENLRKNADWVTVKRIVGASIAASGIDWASDERLCELVLDKSIDDT